MKKYKIYTSCRTGWVYEVVAKSHKDAENEYFNGNWVIDYEDMGWKGESNEEVEKIEEIK